MGITKKIKKIAIWVVFTSIIFNSCDLDLKVGANEKVLYKLKSPGQTNINFSNKIVETDEFSVLGYNNMYMGGGVSIGDINNKQIY